MAAKKIKSKQSAPKKLAKKSPVQKPSNSAVQKKDSVDQKIEEEFDELDKILKKTIKKFNSDFQTRAVGDNSE